MIFKETKLQGAFIIELERLEDNRGFFARTFCKREFEEHGLNPEIAQGNMAYNRTKGTIRGMHFQYPPAGESKIVRCATGAIYDVIVDLRPDSRTFLQSVSVELSEENGLCLYIPEYFAHGYQCLVDHTTTSYQMGEFYAPGHEGGLKFDDPRLGLSWPLPIGEISAKDANWASFDEIEDELMAKMKGANSA